MARYDPGDVVLALFYFNDYSGFKTRPALVLEWVPDREFRICQITSNLRRAEIPGNVLVRKDSEMGRRMGILLDSVINFSSEIIVHQEGIKRKIGHYPYADED